MKHWPESEDESFSTKLLALDPPLLAAAAFFSAALFSAAFFWKEKRKGAEFSVLEAIIVYQTSKNRKFEYF